MIEPADQIVFLGGLPTQITAKKLVKELETKYNVEVQNFPQLFEGFTPRVVLATLEQADHLKKKKKLDLFGRKIDVRPYEDRLRTEDQKHMVFLGGLPKKITVEELKKEMKKLGFTIINRPHLGDGYARDVQFETKEEANNLVRLKQFLLAGHEIDVRPFVNVYAQNRFFLRNKQKGDTELPQYMTNRIKKSKPKLHSPLESDS